ncbi:hypothetical protein O9G_001852 [Rozella allomycis CSF55]|uniref:Uncharacterized protein n=1 Tax=Rozella allomycis (strain CSF55) TaxID=988480 RepID=A0A075B0C2_ROZAC|nr:hypothetical protein O9G_001852 [Rozella allomycis CSF55]|eukprot:EPZ34239.1 hypothetical protein O9G_001852 [Rozella allomycis CSF55]
MEYLTVTQETVLAIQVLQVLIVTVKDVQTIAPVLVHVTVMDLVAVLPIEVDQTVVANFHREMPLIVMVLTIVQLESGFVSRDGKETCVIAKKAAQRIARIGELVYVMVLVLAMTDI